MPGLSRLDILGSIFARIAGVSDVRISEAANCVRPLFAQCEVRPGLGFPLFRTMTLAVLAGLCCTSTSAQYRIAALGFSARSSSRSALIWGGPRPCTVGCGIEWRGARKQPRLLRHPLCIPSVCLLCHQLKPLRSETVRGGIGTNAGSEWGEIKAALSNCLAAVQLG